MTYLPSLFKKIDNFYSQATAFTKQAEQDYFEELTAIANSVGDPGLARQLRMLAELYRYALSMGGGYATIAHAIRNLKELYSDGEDSDIESILNGMLGVLAKEAGGAQALAGRDNPRFLERLMQLKSDIESRPEENDDAYESYQDEVNVSGATGESEGELGEYGLGGDSETVAPAALGFGNKEDPKANRGWHTTGPSKLHRNWKEYFANEVNAYNIQLSQTQNPNVAKTLQELISLIPQLSEMVEDGTALADQLKVAPDEEGNKKLDALRGQIKTIRARITNLKKSIRSHQLKTEEFALADQLAEATRKNDLKAKELLEQKLALNKLSQSNDVFKTKERNLRLRLIESMSGGNFPGKDTLEKEKSKIQLAKSERVTKEAYDRKITEERGKQQAREVTPEYEATRGGRRVPMEKLSPEKQIDLEKASFSALVYQFQIDIASATQAARQAIYRAESGGGGRRGAKAKENPEYKAIIDEISEAIRKKDRPALYAAQNKLMNAVAADVFVEKSQLKGYVDVIKLEPHFRKVLENIKEATKNEKPTKQNPTPPPPKLDDSGNLIVANFSEQDKETLNQILNDVNRLRVLYTKHYVDIASMKARRSDKPTTDWWEIKRQVTPRFKKVIEDMGRIETDLALKLHVQRPQEKQLYPNKSPMLKELSEKLKSSSINNRMTMLKFAQENVPEQEVDKATADRLANEFFDKVYDEAYQKMFSELQA
jgi:hypothetical protein